MDGSDVPVEHDEVGEEAWFEASFTVFPELSEGRGLGVGIDGFRKRDALLGVEAHGAGFILTGDGGVEAAEWIDGLNGIVGAEGQDDVVVEHAAPGVRVLSSFGTEALRGPVHVREQVRGLHRGR